MRIVDKFIRLIRGVTVGIALIICLIIKVPYLLISLRPTGKVDSLFQQRTGNHRGEKVEHPPGER